ncbi:MAG: DUF2231 domain-containing protein [Bdellovibrionota bacterium]
MNLAHLHLIIVHVPIVITPLALAILLLGLSRDQQNLQQLSYALLVICGLSAAAASWTGDGAEETVEHLAGVSERVIENHEEAAELTVWLCAASGVLAAVGLFMRASTAARMVGLLTVLVTTASAASLGYTGYLGGKIRHPETSSSTQIGSSEMQEDND